MLYGLGGLTFWNERYDTVLRWKDRIFISAAGPATGLIIGLAFFIGIKVGLFGELPQAVIMTPWDVGIAFWASMGEWVAFTVSVIVWVSLFWGLFNLLPIGGLDGSHILQELMERWRPGRGRVEASWIGLAVAGIAAIWTFRMGYILFPLILLFFAMNDFARVTGKRAPFQS